MLMTINGGNVPNCQYRQDDIVHLVSNAQHVAALGLPFVFTDLHAALDYARFFGALGDLKEVAWELFHEAPQLDGYCHPGRAAIVKLLSIYREMMYPLTQIEVQKLAYFLASAGQDLGTLKFEKNKFGPYAPSLRHVLTKMDGAFLTGVGDGTNPSEITVLNAALGEADTLLDASADKETGERVKRISRLIEGFETPYGMELLATVHWSAAENPKATLDEIVQAVQGWNARKRQIMSPAHIKAAHDRLVAEKWL